MADDEQETPAASMAEVRATRARGKATIRRLCQAGREALDEVAYGELRVDDVVRRAGTSHGTFYLYFADKRDLLDALRADLVHELTAVAGTLPGLARGNESRAGLERWMAEVLRVLGSATGVVKGLLAADPGWDGGQFRLPLEASMVRRLDELTELDGAMPRVPSAHTARAFSAMLVGLGTGAELDDDAQASIVRVLHRGLVPGKD